MYKLVIVDDEPSVRNGLRTFFDWSAYDIEVVGEAEDGDIALELIEQLQPDLILTDVLMPNMDGIRLSLALRSRFPHLKIIFITSYSILNIVQELIERYMSGYAFENQSGEFVGVVCIQAEEHKEDQLYALAEDVRDNLLRWLKISVTIGVGEQVNHLADLPHSYSQAREATDQKWYLGKNQIISMDNMKVHDENFYRFEAKENEHLLSILKSADSEKLSVVLIEIFAALSNNRREGIKYGSIVVQHKPASSRKQAYAGAEYPSSRNGRERAQSVGADY
ncbi:response regulator [Paenibacillus psychroresistens]|uniref:Response regulator n=1 Tax=Paenibacillus psychroresistens TaxID=1778678 RepID=A0A6B8RF34_9BACL|nr:response regulator [Paenibacillus psychroresistens]QGQ94165.1 response regulator [Paenibacillus psychroresistens]